MRDTYSETRYEVQLCDPREVETFETEYAAREFLNRMLAAGREAYLSRVVRHISDPHGMWTEERESL